MELFKTEEGRRYLKAVEGNTFKGGTANEWWFKENSYEYVR
jgi:hypothetical protein